MDAYTVFDAVLDHDARAELLDELADGGANAPQLDQGSADPSYRQGRIHWLYHHPRWDWLHAALRRLSDDANAKWGFDVDHIESALQLTTYSPGPVGFDWHIDIGTSDIARCRKLTVVVEIGESGLATGGGVDVMRSRDPEPIRLESGQAVVFPAFVLHRAVPPSRGERTSLVAWLSGPPLR
ncbi:MAG: 2OG-Fe(II) oxygenase [Actinomycetota bacterium]